MQDRDTTSSEFKEGKEEINPYEFMGRVKHYGKAAMRLEAHIRALRGCLLPGAVRYDGDAVQRSPEDRMPEAVAEICEAEAQLREALRKKAEAEMEVNRLIDSLEGEDEKTVLSLYYLAEKSVRDDFRTGEPGIASMMHYSPATVYKFLRKGMKKISEKLKV